jgi:cytochrome bd-type quinol oxidase subunit 2
MTYPVILPSFSTPAQSLTIWNAASERPVLIALLVWLAVLTPAAIGYGLWLRRRGRTGTATAGEMAR